MFLQDAWRSPHFTIFTMLPSTTSKRRDQLAACLERSTDELSHAVGIWNFHGHGERQWD
jgi:hypothetical protein